MAGCGYTGERCADFFCRDGAEVTGLVSSEESARRLAAKPYGVLAANAADREELKRRFSGHPTPDLLVHCLSGHAGRDADAYLVTYVQTLRNLLDVLQPEFCVFTGSTSVYPEKGGGLVTEESPTGGTPTADVLLRAERLALEAGGAVVRLGGIYGPGRTRFIEAARTGTPTPGDPGGFINFIHRDDAAAALHHVGRHHLAGIWNAVDDHPVRRQELTEAIRTGSSLAARNPLPGATGKRVQNTKLKSTGWTPQYPGILDAIRARAV
ncbi:MAG: NAD-dependent epimerase/dehydratase family protein [Chthoniobacterales bacterium]